MQNSILSSINNIAGFLNTGLPGKIASKTITYTALGSGAVASSTLFNVTGAVACVVYGVCSEDLVSAGGGTVEIGITGNTALLIAQTTATAIDNGEIWRDNSPSTSYALNSTNFPLTVISSDILHEVKTGTVSDGTITFYCLWTPLTVDGDVTAA